VELLLYLRPRLSDSQVVEGMRKHALAEACRALGSESTSFMLYYMMAALGTGALGSNPFGRVGRALDQIRPADPAETAANKERVDMVSLVFWQRGGGGGVCVYVCVCGSVSKCVDV
jgi:hypothetical protein